MMKKIKNDGDYVIGLVIYHPDDNLLDRINLIKSLGFRLYIFDNSPSEQLKFNSIKNDSDIFYFTAGKNVGLGYSLSVVCATAYAHGYKKLLFLDQDTRITNRTLAFINEFNKNMSVELNNHYVALVFNGATSSNTSIVDVRLAINSGALFDLRIANQIGWHNENYFVDCVDYEFCLRARRYGFKIGIVKNTPDFDHVTDQPDREIRIFGKNLLVRRYSIVRIVDAISAYLKIIIGGIFRNNIKDTVAVVFSMVVYVLNQIVARLIKEKY